MQKLTAMSNVFVGVFQKGCCTISKSRNTQTRRSATTRYRPWQSRCARVKRQLLGKRPRGLPHLRELLLFCACVRAGADLRPNLETNIWRRDTLSRSQVEIETMHPFWWIFLSLKLSEPTFVSTCSVHRSYCGRILYIWIKTYGLHRSGYHKQQWPYIPEIFSYIKLLEK